MQFLVQGAPAGGYQIYCSGLEVAQVLDVLRISGTLDIIGEDHIFPTLVSALDEVRPMGTGRRMLRVHQK